jgi:hypothetical protein
MWYCVIFARDPMRLRQRKRREERLLLRRGRELGAHRGAHEGGVQTVALALRAEDLREVVAGLAVRGEAHHLVLLVVLPEAEVLGQHRIEDAEGVRLPHPQHLRELLAAGVEERGAGAVAREVHGQDERVGEPRVVVGRGGVAVVVVEETHLRGVPEVELEVVAQDRLEVLVGDPGEADGRHVADAYPGPREAVLDRLLRQVAVRVLDPEQALLLGGGHDAAVFEQARRAVLVAGEDSAADPEQVHGSSRGPIRRFSEVRPRAARAPGPLLAGRWPRPGVR